MRKIKMLQIKDVSYSLFYKLTDITGAGRCRGRQYLASRNNFIIRTSQGVTLPIAWTLAINRSPYYFIACKYTDFPRKFQMFHAFFMKTKLIHKRRSLFRAQETGRRTLRNTESRKVDKTLFRNRSRGDSPLGRLPAIATFFYFNETNSCVGFVAFFVSLQQNFATKT